MGKAAGKHTSFASRVEMYFTPSLSLLSDVTV